MAASIVPSIVEQQIMVVLQALLGNFVDGGESAVYRSQQNGLPEPLTGAGSFILLTPLTRVNLETATATWEPASLGFEPTTLDANTPVRFGVQIDVFGEGASDVIQAVKAAWLTDWAFQTMAPTCEPLYTDDARQSAFVNDSVQYEDRWTLTAEIQYNPSISTPMDFADSAAATLTAADVIYKG